MIFFHKICHFFNPLKGGRGGTFGGGENPSVNSTTFANVLGKICQFLDVIKLKEKTLMELTLNKIE